MGDIIFSHATGDDCSGAAKWRFEKLSDEAKTSVSIHIAMAQQILVT